MHTLRGLPKDDGASSEIADNVLDRQFTSDAPNQKWVAAFTCIWLAEGWLYVAMVLDLYSRHVVSWSMPSRTTLQLVSDALMMAVWRRGTPLAWCKRLRRTTCGCGGNPIDAQSALTTPAARATVRQGGTGM